MRSAEEQKRAGGGGGVDDTASPEVARGIPAAFAQLIPVEDWLAVAEETLGPRHAWRPAEDLDLEVPAE